MKKFIIKLIDSYKFWADRRGKEISACLAYYFIMGLVPALCLLFWVFKDNSPVRIFLNSGIFDGLKSTVEQLSTGASLRSKTGGVAVFITSLYSAVNLIYRFRLSGELLYGKRAERGYFKKKLYAFIGVGAILLFICAIIPVCIIMEKLIGGIFLKTAVVVVSVLIAFLGILIMNRLICPFKTNFKSVYRGSLITLLLWLVLTFVYNLYLQNFSSYGLLYGTLSGVFTLMLYVYLVMQAFTVGVTYNAYKQNL